METSDPNLLSRFRGAILGGGVADALAFPYQHYSRAFLRSLAAPLVSEFMPHHSRFYPPGQYSDETQTMLAVLASIIEEGKVSGQAMASRLLALSSDNLLVETDPSIAQAIKLLEECVGGCHRAGLEPGHAEAAPAARTVPLALWDHRDLAKLSHDVETCVRLTHRDSRCIASAAAVAAAISSNLRTEELVLGNFLDDVAEAAGKFDSVVKETFLDFPRILSLSEKRALKHLEALCPDDRYPATADGLSAYCVPTVSTALYYFLKSPYRYEKTVESCLRVGGRIDTAAFLAGAISGALVGENGVPAHLTAGLLNAAEIAARADQLHGAWIKHKR